MIMMNIKKLIGYGLMTLGLSINAQSHYPGQHEDKLKLQDTKRVVMKAFDVENVTLLDSRFKANMKRESEWILSLKVNSLLHSFRTNAGVYSGYEGGYDTTEKLGGWESLDCELRGHTIGHVLSGLSLLYATTKDNVYKQKGDSLVYGLAEVQKALNQNGYLSAYPQHLINRNIAGKRVWAPWYTLHKIYAGLIDQYLYTNNEEALQVVEKMAIWAYDKLQDVSTEQRAIMLRNEFGGVNDSFYALYLITGNTKYKWLAEFFYHDQILEPLKSKTDNLYKKHANTYIPKLIGLARAYEIEGGEANKTSPVFFWNTVVDHHSFVTGSNSDKEKFFEADHETQHLTGYTGESCNVYNMLKLTRHLYGIHGDVKYMDFYEKALYNHILGQQDPETGMIAYFLPMLPGAHKVYSTKQESFWCCVGTGFENHAKYGETIYYHDDNALYVNLFIASEINWKAKGLQLKQETQYPYKPSTTFTMTTSEAIKMPLKIRYPSWAKNGVQLKVNGKPIKVRQKPGSYISIDRTWKNNDSVEITFPMDLHLSSDVKKSNQMASILYGPIVLAAKLGTENMLGTAPYSNPDLHNDYYTYDYKVPTSLSNSIIKPTKKLKQWIIPVETAPLHFKIETGNKEITLMPLFDLHRERYNVYWKFQK